jgi:2,3-bisphosphoglycerate-dependent phosphoglycerate mutase
MELYFIRHAQSENNALWLRTGSWRGRDPDPGLTEIGHRQAVTLARYLARPARAVDSAAARQHNRHHYDFTHLYCSLMRRAVVTGAYIASASELPLVAWEEIHERGGIYRHDEESDELQGLPGGNRAYFAENYPELIVPDSLAEDGWWNRPVEPQHAIPVRARRFLDKLRARHGHSADRVAIVSHAGFYQAMLGALLGIVGKTDGFGNEADVFFGMNNAAISRIDFNEQEAVLIYQNRVLHLPAELLT